MGTYWVERGGEALEVSLLDTAMSIEEVGVGDVARCDGPTLKTNISIMWIKVSEIEPMPAR